MELYFAHQYSIHFGEKPAKSLSRMEGCYCDVAVDLDIQLEDGLLVVRREWLQRVEVCAWYCYDLFALKHEKYLN